MTTYIGVDPGLKTGLFVWGSEDPERHGWAELPMDEIRQWMAWEVAEARRPLVIVTERFTIGSHTVKQHVYYESLYINGWLLIEYPEYMAPMQMPRVAKQENVERKSANLKRLGWYHKTKDGHANDAAAHVMIKATKDRQPWVLDRRTED